MVKFGRFWGSRKGVIWWLGWVGLEGGSEGDVGRVGMMGEKGEKDETVYCDTSETEGGGNGDLAPSGGISP